MAKAKAAAAKQKSDPVSVILPGVLYLGPCSSASSIPFLMSNSITHVLSIGSTASPQIEGIIYHRLSLNDSITSLITSTMDSATVIINNALRSNKGTGRILVHCMAGVSRSPTIVTAYLMKEHAMSLKTALGLVVRARPQVSPNLGFLWQLKDLEVELFGTSTLNVDALPRRESDRLALFGEPVGDDDGATGSSSAVVDPLDTEIVAEIDVCHRYFHSPVLAIECAEDLGAEIPET